MSQWRNLVFEGGGVKGLAYAGALEILEEKGILDDIVRVGGSSAGGICAGLLAIGVTSDELRRSLEGTDFAEFMDDDWGAVRDINRLLNEYGWHKGEAIKEWFKTHLRAKVLSEGITFKELKENPNTRDLYLTGSNIDRSCIQFYSHEHTPDMPIIDALRITMSYPFFFKAIKYPDDNDGKSDPSERCVFIDGGLLRNYPINFFDNRRYIDPNEIQAAKDDFSYITDELREAGYVYNCQTLGLRIDSPEEVDAFKQGISVDKDIDGFLNFCVGLVNTMMEYANKSHLHKNDWHRTVFIENPGVSTLDFTLSDEQRSALIESGREGVNKYFDWFNDFGHEDRPINRYSLPNP